MKQGEIKFMDRDQRTAAIFEVFVTTQNRDALTRLLGMVDDSERRDRAFLDDMRRG